MDRRGAPAGAVESIRTRDGATSTLAGAGSERELMSAPPVIHTRMAVNVPVSHPDVLVRVSPHRRLPDLLAAALVIGCFCVPLFMGLGNRDLANDESIYSYSVVRMLETGEWLTPRAIPFDGPFLEKPPLKFWMVAAPIALGVLSPDEYGLRAVDALLGSIAFVYVFLLGRWQAGAVAGISAVLVLFTFDPLVFVHGLRSNDMEAALVLAYAGGVYHFARWLDGGGVGRAARHRWPTALYFTLGFLTKFVAVLFLPLVCVAAVLLRRDSGPLDRVKWRAWLAPAALMIAAIAPWFIYQTLVSGWDVWNVMFLQHVYTRFTGALDVHHLQPWNYYVFSSWDALGEAGSQWLVVAGAAALAAAAVRTDGWLARVFLFWGIVPVALVSMGSSKVFHYIYPFLPPIALGAGYAASLVFHATAGLLERVAGAANARMPAVAAPDTRLAGALRTLLTALAAAAALVGLFTAINGALDWKVGAVQVLRSASLTRPFLVGAVLLWIAGRPQWAARAVATAVLMMALPVSTYPSKLERTESIHRPLHAARDCLRAVRDSGAAVGTTVYGAASSLTHHGYNYYLREFEPWMRVAVPDAAELRRRLVEPGQQSPVILLQADYLHMALAIATDGIPRTSGTSVPAGGLVGFTADPGLVVLLPGPYAECAAPAVRAGARAIGFAADRRLPP
jgi:4-amino-4-deoxy-L-arabinose transferase-like glycosyltransferase